MGNVSSHTASFIGGGVLAGSVIGILTAQFHIDAELATDWLIVIAAIFGGPVMAYLSVKAQTDPALAAALAALNAMANTGQTNGTVSTGGHQTVITTPAAEAAPKPLDQPPAPLAPLPQGQPA